MNQLVTETSDEGTITYTFDENGNLIKQRGDKTVDYVVSYGDGTSDRFEFIFTPECRALVPISEVELGYKCVTNQKVKLEIVGDTTVYPYDDNGNILRTVDAYGNKTDNTYNKYNNLPTATDAKPHMLIYA